QLRRLMADAVSQPSHPRLAIPGVDVLATTARERVVRVLQARALGLNPVLGSGEPIEDAMLSAWRGRASGERHRERVREGMRRLAVIVPGSHRAILSRADFEEIQRRMALRRTSPSEQHRHQYLLAGLARCGHCGNRLIGVRRPGVDTTLVYYQCQSATNHGRC